MSGLARCKVGSGLGRWSFAKLPAGVARPEGLLDGHPFRDEAAVRINHLAIWARDIEVLCRFYETYFGARSGARYANPAKGFESRFLAFDSDARLEIMQADTIGGRSGEPGAKHVGYAHLAISVGSREQVDQLTAQLRHDGYMVLDGPRTTGDGYYESVVLDPEGNRVEITV
jgi:lactoylglutathione lyase